ncbi:fruit protein pKIWI502-like [Setaria italica]|uniref:fruit protein pKIWI502-like n=1 Tax=Setaria italica TaxID=4555 RepID=UPI000BE4DE87|nr:fruit protein pKIWI502-like [Setaria italica]
MSCHGDDDETDASCLPAFVSMHPHLTGRRQSMEGRPAVYTVVILYFVHITPLPCSPPPRPRPERLHLLRQHHLRLLSAAAPTEWAEAPLASVRPATADASLYHISLDLSAHRGLLASHAAAGQFLPFRLPAAPYPIFLAIASPPPSPGSSSAAAFDFLVKRVPGTPSARLCDLRPGDLVHVGASVVGRGFEVNRIADARDVLVFATGSGIRCLPLCF